MLRRVQWLPALLVGFLGAWFLCGPALFHPFTLAATSLYSEGPGHLWGLWLATMDFPEHYGFLRSADVGWPDTFSSHLMDPINIVVFGPGYLLGGRGLRGAIFGWNLLHAAVPIIGAMGVWQLTRRLLGDHPSRPWAAMLGALVFVVSPYFLLYPQMGRTEYLPAVLFPWHLAFFHRWMRRPSPLAGAEVKLDEKPPLWVGLAAALSLGAAALGGWYLAVFMALADGLLGLLWMRGLRFGEAVGRIALVAVLSVTVTLPAAWALVNFGIPVDLNGLTMEPARCIAGAALVRVFQTTTLPQLDFEPYIGLLPLAAGLFVAVRRPKSEAAWLLVALFCLSFALGRRVAWNPTNLAACESGVPSPLALANWLVPSLRAMRSWTRIMVIASAFGAGAVIVATATIWPKLGRLAIPLSLLAGGFIFWDNTTYPQKVSMVPATFDPTPPAHLQDALAVLPPGPVVTYPLDIRLREASLEEHGLWNLWQIVMDRPISAGALGATDATEGSKLSQEVAARQLAAVKAHTGTANRASMAGDSPMAGPTAADVEYLRDGSVELMLKGYSSVLLLEDMEAGGDLRTLLTAGLGPPAYDFDGVVGWNLHDLPAVNFVSAPGDDSLGPANTAEVKPAGRGGGPR